MQKKKLLKMFREIKIEAMVFVLLTILMALFWKNSWFVTISLFLLFVAAMIFWERRPYDIPVYIAAFLLAPLIDLIAIPAGAWSYRNPDFLNIPFWLFTGYAIGVLLIVRMGETAYRILNGEYDPNKPKVKQQKDIKRGILEMIGSLFIHFLLILTIVLLWHKPVAVTLILITLFIVQKNIWEKHPYDNYIFAMALIFATVMEWVSVYYGSWTYPNPLLLNIPLYIPFAYGLGSFNVFKIYISIQRLFSKKRQV